MLAYLVQRTFGILPKSSQLVFQYFSIHEFFQWMYFSENIAIFENEFYFFGTDNTWKYSQFNYCVQ